MGKIIFFLLILLSSLITLISPQQVKAETAGTSAVLMSSFDTQQQDNDKRIQVLRAYLEKRNSPLAPYANVFVNEADKNNLDWRLVASISGLESSFGIHIPTYSYNGWGFGVYGDNVLRFSSWEEGIATVSKALRDNYIDKWGATNVYEIGRIYAASPTWAARVTYFMNNIEAFEQDQQRTTLALSL